MPGHADLQKKKIPEAFLLSLTRIYLSAVITYSLMHNTLCWLHGGEYGEHEDSGEGEKYITMHNFLLSPLRLSPACLLAAFLSHTYLILRGDCKESYA